MIIGASTTVLPGVVIGDNVVVGAGSVVNRDIPSNSVAVGNPARVVCSYDDYIKRKKSEMENAPIFDEKYTFRNPNITTEMKKERSIDWKRRSWVC